MIMKIKAFTLSEVLITLVIIGVIAAITVPICIENYHQVSVPAKLKKFYSNMNNALSLWYANSGNYAGTYSFKDSEIRNSQALKNFYEESIGKYLVAAKEPYTSSSIHLIVPLNDGSGFYAYIASANLIHFFYCAEFKHCGIEQYDGKNSFLFSLYLDTGTFVTSSSSMNGKSREEVLSLCKYGNVDNAAVSTPKKRHACARLIQMDGWQIKDDYPWQARSL